MNIPMLSYDDNCFRAVVKTIPNSKTYLYFENDIVMMHILNILDTKDLQPYMKVVKVFKDKSLVEFNMKMSRAIVAVMHGGLEFAEQERIKLSKLN